MLLKSRSAGLLTGLVSLGVVAGLASPVQAVPSVVGSYATVTPSVLRTVDGDSCQDLVQLATTVDLQGIGNAVEAQGYVYSSNPTAKVYSELDWVLRYSITGPDNYYDDEVYVSGAFPTAQGTAVDEVCPSSFGHGRVTAGTYTMSWTLEVGEVTLKHPTEGTNFYETIWSTAGTSSVVVSFSQTCLDARARLVTLKKKLKKAKRAHNKPLVRKLKRKVARTKGVIENAC